MNTKELHVPPHDCFSHSLNPLPLLGLGVKNGHFPRQTVELGRPCFPAGTKVTVLEQRGAWWRVDGLDTVSGIIDLAGWRHSQFLSSAERLSAGPGRQKLLPVRLV